MLIKHNRREIPSLRIIKTFFHCLLLHQVIMSRCKSQYFIIGHWSLIKEWAVIMSLIFIFGRLFYYGWILLRCLLLWGFVIHQPINIPSFFICTLLEDIEIRFSYQWHWPVAALPIFNPYSWTVNSFGFYSPFSYTELPWVSSHIYPYFFFVRGSPSFAEDCPLSHICAKTIHWLFPDVSNEQWWLHQCPAFRIKIRHKGWFY